MRITTEDFAARLADRAAEAARLLEADIEAIHRRAASEGSLKSGGTVRKSIRAAEAQATALASGTVRDLEHTKVGGQHVAHLTALGRQSALGYCEEVLSLCQF